MPEWDIRDVPGGLLAGSDVRLQFEPKGWMREFRDSLRVALWAKHRATTGRAALAYASDSSAFVDIENVLAYNVGGSSTPPSITSISFERVPLTSMAEPGWFPHQYRYEFLSSDCAGVPGHWVGTGSEARVAVALSSVKAKSIWRTVTGEMARTTVGHGIGPLGAWVTLRTRNAITTELVKGVIDGVIAALHIHDGTRAIEMSGLLGGIMKVDPSELLTLLTAAPGDLREARNLFDVRGQIRPADDRLQYIDFRVDREPGPLALSAMIQRLEPIGR